MAPSGPIGPVAPVLPKSPLSPVRAKVTTTGSPLVNCTTLPPTLVQDTEKYPLFSVIPLIT